MTSFNPILLHPFGRVVFGFGFPGKTNNPCVVWQFFFGVGEEVDNLARVQRLQIVGILDGHFQPKIKPDDALVNVLKIVLQGVIDGGEEVVVPNHHRTIVAVLVVFFTGQVASPERRELPTVFEYLIQAARDDHVQVNVELPPLYFVVLEQGDLSPPLLPALLQLHNLDVGVESIRIFSKAIEIKLPCRIPFYSSVKFVHIRSRISSPPFYAQHAYFLVPLVGLFFPAVDSKRLKPSIIGVFLPGESNYLLPRPLDSFLLPPQLPEYVGKIDNRLLVTGLKLQGLLAVLERFVDLVNLNVHYRQVGVGIGIGSFGVELRREYETGIPGCQGGLFGELNAGVGWVVRGNLNGLQILLNSFLVVSSLAVQIAQIHVHIRHRKFILLLYRGLGLFEMDEGFLKIVSLEAKPSELIMFQPQQQILMFWA